MSEDNCPICKDVFSDKVMHDTCKHEFCKSCLNRWYLVSGKKNCPLCRQTTEDYDDNNDSDEQYHVVGVYPVYSLEDYNIIEEEEHDNDSSEDDYNPVDRPVNNIYNIEDVYSDPNFIGLSYESPIYLQTIDKINEYFNDNDYLVLGHNNKYATITVNCNNRVIVHRNCVLYEDFSKAMAIYLMKYLYNSSYSPFDPESKYHYNNDDNNFRFSSISTNETIFDQSTDTKIINITINNSASLINSNKYIIFEDTIFENLSYERNIYNSMFKKILNFLSRQPNRINNKLYRYECKLSARIHFDSTIINHMFNSILISYSYDIVIYELFKYFSNNFSNYGILKSIELILEYENQNICDDSEKIFDSSEEIIEEVANP